MIDANCEPSCSNAIRWLSGVLALTKAYQLVVMAVTAAALPGDVDPEVADGDEAGADDVAGGAEVVFDELGVLPPHAVARTASPASATTPTRCEKCR
jgi:hypothetical protein